MGVADGRGRDAAGKQHSMQGGLTDHPRSTKLRTAPISRGWWRNVGGSTVADQYEISVSLSKIRRRSPLAGLSLKGLVIYISGICTGLILRFYDL